MKNAKTLLGLGFIGFRATSGIRAALAVSVASLLAIGSAQAASNLTWDSAGGHASAPANGAGTWDTTNARWSNGTTDSIWNNANDDIAVFGGGTSTGSGGLVSLSSFSTTPITVGGLIFNITGYSIYIKGNTFTFGGASPSIDVVTGTAKITGNGGAIATGGLNIVKSGVGTLELGGGISAGGISLSGGGTLEVQTGQLNLGDTTYVNIGISLGTTNIQVDNGNAVAVFGSSVTNGSITLGAGSQFSIQNGGTAAGDATTISSSIVLNAGTGSANAAQIGGFKYGNATNITSTISGNGDLRWVNNIVGGGSNSATLTATNATSGWAANSYIGNTSFEGVTLTFSLTTPTANATVTPFGTGAVTITGGSLTFSQTGTTPTNIASGSLAGTGNVALGAGLNLTVANNSAVTGTYSGVLSGAGSFTNSGTGGQVLSGANTYTGTTTVSSGILATDNNSALGTSAVTVSGGTLQVGNGTTATLSGITGLAISGGALDLKTQTGSVSLASGNFTMTLGSTWLLNNNSTTTGGNVDQITLGSGGTYSLTGGTVDLSGFTAGPGTYNIIAGTGFASGLAFTNGQAGDTYSIDNAGNLVVAVPEPSTLVLAGIFGFGMLMLFRRRHS